MTAPAPDPRLPTAAEVEEELLARAPEHRINPGLERVQRACELLGDPQLAYRVVHLTGTNGKTSTCRMTERLLREHGLRTGRFTSPHLSSLGERIAIDGQPLDGRALVRAWLDVEAVVRAVDEWSLAQQGSRMNFFEVLTVMAFAAFADAPVDVAVVEVGLGGTWDATNTVAPQVVIVTPIALDHESWLGSTVELIAGEKAGIIKAGAVAVLAEQPPEAAEVLLARAAEVSVAVAREGFEFAVVDRELAVGGQQVSIRGVTGTYPDLYLPLHGAHQAHNAACALVGVEALLAEPGRPLDLETVRTGFAGVDSPGRLEVVRRAPTVLVDAAHNPAGAAALADAVAEAFTFTRLVGLVGVLADKDAHGLLSALEPVLSEVVVTRSSSPRSASPAALGALAEEIFGADRVRVVDRLDDALDAAITLAETGGGMELTGVGVLATGSVFIAAEVRTLVGARS